MGSFNQVRGMELRGRHLQASAGLPFAAAQHSIQHHRDIILCFAAQPAAFVHGHRRSIALTRDYPYLEGSGGSCFADEFRHQGIPNPPVSVLRSHANFVEQELWFAPIRPLQSVAIQAADNAAALDRQKKISRWIGYKFDHRGLILHGPPVHFDDSLSSEAYVSSAGTQNFEGPVRV